MSSSSTQGEPLAWRYRSLAVAALFRSHCGFDAAKEEQLAPMLAFRDVHH